MSKKPPKPPKDHIWRGETHTPKRDVQREILERREAMLRNFRLGQ